MMLRINANTQTRHANGCADAVFAQVQVNQTA
jgi:hypothetical protein